MPAILLEFLDDAAPWLLVLFLPLTLWAVLVSKALSKPTSNESFQWTIKWLREDRFGQFYLLTLGVLLDKVSGWIGDRGALAQAYVTPAQPRGVARLFGFNPFTPESYEKCLRLAFLYPLLALLLTWVMGGSGAVGEIDFLALQKEEALTVGQRFTLVLSMVAGIGLSLWWVGRFKGWWQWLALNLPFAIAALLLAWAQGVVTGIEIFVVLWLLFLFLFIPSYSVAWCVTWLFYCSRSAAHALIYKPIFAFAGATAVAFAVAFAGAAAAAGATAGAAAGAAAVAGVVAVAVVGALAGAFAFAFAFAFADTSSVAGTGIGAFAGAGVVIALLLILQQTLQKRGRADLFWLLYTLFFLSVGFFSLSWLADSQYMLLLLFWLILPLVNAALDWLSLGVTRGLLQAVRAGHHSSQQALLWALVDLALALVFLFLITAVLVGVTALGNGMAGETLVPIQAILQGVRNDPTGVDQWWLYFMLLSTLIPTLIHFALAGGAAALWLPQRYRAKLATDLERAPEQRNVYKSFGAWAYLTFTPIVGFILAPLALLWGLWAILTAHGAWLGYLLLGWADWLVRVAESV